MDPSTGLDSHYRRLQLRRLGVLAVTLGRHVAAAVIAGQGHAAQQHGQCHQAPTRSSQGVLVLLAFFDFGRDKRKRRFVPRTPQCQPNGPPHLRTASFT